MVISEPIPIVFYKEEGSGNEPVRDWLLSLNKEAKEDLDLAKARSKKYGP